MNQTDQGPSQLNKKMISVAEGLEMISSGDCVVTAMATTEPVGFFQGLGERAKSLADLRVYCANPSVDYPCFRDPELQGKLELATMFLTAPIRKNQGHGVVTYIPQHLSQWTKHLFRRGPVDVFWGSCTPPDKRGFVNLGPGACYEQEVLRSAKIVILEINSHLPRTYGSTAIPSSWVDHFIDNSHELVTIARPKITDTDLKIAKYVAGLVESESTIQLGIGSIPNAIGKALHGKKNLGVHTEMINDTIMDLFLAGVITGKCKSIWPGQIVGSFALGSQDLYDFIDNNPLVEFQPSSVVNDPYRIGRNHKMVSINTAVEVDITGQVCSESIGHRELSGVGGATDTHIGAQRSEGGRGIIALHSTTRNDDSSKISFELLPGAKVSISRNDVDTIVTEYGIAELAGVTVAERVKKLVGIAHPKFRDDLWQKATETGYL